MGTPNKYRPEFCQTAFEILSRGKSLAAVCANLGICRPTLYEWRDMHPDFGAAINQGLQNAQSVWEDIGEDGIKGNFEKFNSTPWIFVMKNRFREDYKEDKTEHKSVSDAVVEKLLDKLID